MIKIGILVESPLGSKYLLELIEWSRSQPGITMVHLLIQPSRARAAARRRPLSKLSELTFSVIKRVEQLWLRKIGIYQDHLVCCDLRSAIPHVLEMAADVPLPDLDLIVCETLLPDAKLAHAAKLGVLQLSYGDNDNTPERIAGFWEVYARTEHTSFALLQFTQHGVNTILPARVATRYFFLFNQAALFTAAHMYLRDCLREVADRGEFRCRGTGAPATKPTPHVPGVLQQLAYISRTAIDLMRNRLHRALAIEQKWHVAFSRSKWQSLVRSEACIIDQPPNHYLADPFVISDSGRDYCFVEDFDFAKRTGSIAVYELREQAAEKLGIVVSEPFHLSFPYLFRWNGTLFMCPESGDVGEIRIYECVRFPLEWKYAKTLMRDVKAFDSMLFEHGDRWWLLTTLARGPDADAFSEFAIFFADNPLSEHWTPHAMNPIYVDSTRGRNAGIVRDGNYIYRVAQRQGFDVYGKALSLNRIVTLTPAAYAEERGDEIEPDFRAGLIGTHHLHSDGRLTVFDYATKERRSTAG